MGNRAYGKGWNDGNKHGLKKGKTRGAVGGGLFTAILGGIGGLVTYRSYKKKEEMRKKLLRKRIIYCLLLLFIITIAAMVAMYLYVK